MLLFLLLLQYLFSDAAVANAYASYAATVAATVAVATIDAVVAVAAPPLFLFHQN